MNHYESNSKRRGQYGMGTYLDDGFYIYRHHPARMVHY